MTRHAPVKPETYVSAAPMIMMTWRFLLVLHASTGKVFSTIMLVFHFFNLFIKVEKPQTIIYHLHSRLLFQSQFYPVVI